MLYRNVFWFCVPDGVYLVCISSLETCSWDRMDMPWSSRITKDSMHTRTVKRYTGEITWENHDFLEIIYHAWHFNSYVFFPKTDDEDVGLRENLQETIDVPIQYGSFPASFPLNQSIEMIFHCCSWFHGTAPGCLRLSPRGLLSVVFLTCCGMPRMPLVNLEVSMNATPIVGCFVSWKMP